jgi:hypothetical protein
MMKISNIQDVENIVYSTEVLMSLFLVFGMDMHLGHIMV